MATRSGAEYRAGNNSPGTSEDMPEWAKTLVRNLDKYWRSQEESKAQIEFIMTQLLDLKTERTTEDTNHTTPKPSEPTDHHEVKIWMEEPRWDAAKRGAKPEVSLFDGSLDPKKYMDWEVSLDEYFEWLQLPEGRRIQFAQMKLAGQARIYWRNLQATAERRCEVAVTTWTEMKGPLREKYVPACYRPMIIDEWQHLQQGDGTVVEYITRFDDLMIRCNIDEEPVATLARFPGWIKVRIPAGVGLTRGNDTREGLPLHHEHGVILFTCSTGWPCMVLIRTGASPACYPGYPHLTPLISSQPICHWIPQPSALVPPPLPRPPLRLLLPPTTSEASLPPANVGYRNRAGNPTNPPPIRAVPPTLPAAERPTEGRNTGGARPMYISAQPASANSRTTCFMCQGWGHFASQCPSPRQAARPARALLVEIQDEEHTPTYDTSETTTEVYEADPNLAAGFEEHPGTVGCIIKEITPLTSLECTIALAVPLDLTPEGSYSPSDSTQTLEDPIRTTIFSTFTKITNTVIKVLVDSGSVVNAVAAASVPALGLAPEVHRLPYKAMWINDISLAVTHWCLVTLRVDGYGADIWCDVLPMGVGSIVLGRPWLYDFDVAQYGRTNYCVFFCGGSKQVWKPFIPPTKKEESQLSIPVNRSPMPQRIGLVSARQIIKGLDHDAPMWAVQVRTKVATNATEGYPAFLEDFADVFPTELPDQLPPEREIQHFIDFIPGAPLPNLPHYRLSPSQSAKLQRQVEDLLRRGFI